MLYSGHVFEFRCEFEPQQLERPLNDAGPYEWRSFNSDEEGVYLVSNPDAHSDIKLRGRAPQLSMTIEFLCEDPAEAADFEASRARVLATVRERLLPAAGASDIREDAG